MVSHLAVFGVPFGALEARPRYSWPDPKGLSHGLPIVDSIV